MARLRADPDSAVAVCPRAPPKFSLGLALACAMLLRLVQSFAYLRGLMSTATAFRRTLAHRLLVLLAFPVSGAAGGCTGVGTSCPDSDPQPTEACFAWPPEDAGAGGAGGGTGAGDACPSPTDAAQRL